MPPQLRLMIKYDNHWHETATLCFATSKLISPNYQPLPQIPVSYLALAHFECFQTSKEDLQSRLVMDKARLYKLQALTQRNLQEARRRPVPTKATAQVSGNGMNS